MKPEAQLGARRSRIDEPRRVGCGNPLTGGGYITLETHDAPFFAVAEVFFRRSRLFVLFHPTKPTAPKAHIRYSVYSVYPPQKKEHSLLVLPFVNAILNFATKFFEMFTKKQS
ncbi:MAG: hypothetical protein PUE25_10155 [bacterium]|nr:hypothetical protein [bacterium]